ncbi:MAG: hypothetical protein HOK54_24705 [Alphaproteobacteria bacterium]|nr:hypothetical protein [Alphaproteobacteria bacterium]
MDKMLLIRALVVAVLMLQVFVQAGETEAADGYAIIEKGGDTVRVLNDGTLKGRVAWAFDTPTEGSAPMGLLLQHLRAAHDIAWASYKPTHPEVISVLNEHPRAWGIYDRNYCGKACLKAYGRNDRITPIGLGIYKKKSKRKWFVMHHKFAVLNLGVDGGAGEQGVLTGSFNWNESAANRNYENLVYIQSRKIAEAYAQEFKRIESQETDSSEIVSDEGVSVAFNRAGVGLIQDRIKAAKQTVLVAVWSISVSSAKNPNPLYDALLAAVERGVDVRVLTDAHKAKKRKYEKLNVLKAHMPDKKGHMHHKFIVIDGDEVVTGSFNFVTKSLSGNYENVIAIKSPAMAASFADHWKSVAKATR